jgi:hypothetical protein
MVQLTKDIVKLFVKILEAWIINYVIILNIKLPIFYACFYVTTKVFNNKNKSMAKCNHILGVIFLNITFLT